MVRVHFSFSAMCVCVCVCGRVAAAITLSHHAPSQQHTIVFAFRSPPITSSLMGGDPSLTSCLPRLWCVAETSPSLRAEVADRSSLSFLS